MTISFRKLFMLIILFSAFSQTSFTAGSPLFSEKERAWLKDHSNIRLVVNTRPAPISMWGTPSATSSPGKQFSHSAPPLPGDEDPILSPFPHSGSNVPLVSAKEVKQGKFQGIAADYLREIATITGITFTAALISDNNFRAISDALHKGDADIMPSVMLGQPDISSLTLSDPYVRIPVVIVMQQDSPHLEDVTLLNSMNVAGVLSIPQKLKALGLNTKIHHASPHDGLLGVATGKYDAYLSELSEVSDELARNPVTNIKIVGELPFPSEFCLAAASQSKDFIPIFNKAVKAISQEKKDEIWRKWFRINYEKKYFSTGWFWGMGLSSLIAMVIGAMGFFYYRGHLSKMKSGLAALEPHLLCIHTDDNITITDVTKAFCEATGFTPEHLVGKPLLVLGNPDSAPQCTLEAIFETVKKEDSWQGEIKLIKKDGSELWTDVVISPRRRKNEKETGYTVIYQDATKRKHYETLAVRDELTGLFNRRHFNAVAPQLLEQAACKEHYFCMYLLDVDNFKKYNDNYGHHAGDSVLTSIGKTLAQSLQRGDDFCFRLGGEEFGVITLFANPEAATDIAQKILKTINDLRIEHYYNPAGIVTVSIGVRVVTGDYKGDIDTIYQQADKALYEAKESGKNRFVGFDGRGE